MHLRTIFFFFPQIDTKSGRNRTKRSSSAFQSPPGGTQAHVNDSHVGGSDFGRASSKLSSPRLVLAVPRAGARDLERLFCPNRHEESGCNQTECSSSASQSPPRGTYAHVNDPHTGGSDFGRASSKLGSSRLCLVQVRTIWSTFSPKIDT